MGGTVPGISSESGSGISGALPCFPPPVTWSGARKEFLVYNTFPGMGAGEQEEVKQTSTQGMWLRGKAIAQHLGVPRFHSRHHTQGEKQNKARSTENRLPLALPSPFSYSMLFTHLDFPLSLAPPRFPVSPGLHYLMLTYIQGPSGRNKVCSQSLSWSLNSKGYFLFSLNLNLSPPESEVKSFSGRVPTNC